MRQNRKRGDFAKSGKHPHTATNRRRIVGLLAAKLTADMPRPGANPTKREVAKKKKARPRWGHARDLSRRSSLTIQAAAL